MPDLRDESYQPMAHIEPNSSAVAENLQHQTDKAENRSKVLGCGCLSVIGFCVIAFFSRIPHPGLSSKSAVEAPAVPRWDYAQQEDKVRGYRWTEATIYSTTTINFDFPYDGGSNAWIKLSTQGDVTLGVTKGQFNCQGVPAPHPILIKVDDQPSKRFGCDTSSELKPSEVWISDGAAFTKAINGRHHIVIQAPFYQAGDKQFEFDIPGPAW